jgi:cysteine desulfurase
MAPEVLDAMTPFFSETFGNPSSLHSIGQKAKQEIDKARRTCAEFLNASPREIIFTSGGTESDNLAIFGCAGTGSLITSSIEHEAVLEPMKVFGKKGSNVTYLPADPQGLIKADALKQALSSETSLVSLMAANNEVGTIQPIAEFAQIIHDNSKALFHTDACQATGVMDLNVKDLGVDLLTLNGGKIYGPKGIGLLYVKQGIKLQPQLYGGGQEHRLRSGTQNVAAIIGLAKAIELTQGKSTHENERLAKMRDHFIKATLAELDDVTLTGAPTQRLPNNISFIIKGVESEILLMRLDMEGIFASAGSACTAGNAEPSHVLLALGHSKQEAHTAVRFSLGRGTTQDDLDHVLKTFLQIVKDIRKESGVY